MSDTLRAILFIAGGYALFRLVMNRGGSAPVLSVSETIMKNGDRNDSVRAVQEALQFLGYSTGLVDGWFGPETERSVRRFQQDMGIQNDGIVGPETLATLDEELRKMGGGLRFRG